MLHELPLLENDLAVLRELSGVVETLALRQLGDVHLTDQVAVQLLVIRLSGLGISSVSFLFWNAVSLHRLVQSVLLINFFQLGFIDFLGKSFSFRFASLLVLGGFLEELVVLEGLELLPVQPSFLFSKVFLILNLLFRNLVFLRSEELLGVSLRLQRTQKTLRVALDFLTQQLNVLHQVNLVVHVFLSVLEGRLDLCYWHL